MIVWGAGTTPPTTWLSKLLADIACFFTRHPTREIVTTPTRIRLRCTHCGRVSPGWELEGRLEGTRR